MLVGPTLLSSAVDDGTSTPFLVSLPAISLPSFSLSSLTGRQPLPTTCVQLLPDFLPIFWPLNESNSSPSRHTCAPLTRHRHPRPSVNSTPAPALRPQARKGKGSRATSCISSTTCSVTLQSRFRGRRGGRQTTSGREIRRSGGMRGCGKDI